MRATFEFSLPDDQYEYDICRMAPSYCEALEDIAQKVFRPARKHGYSDVKLAGLLKLADGEGCAGSDLIGALEERFYEILREHGIELP